MKKTYINPSVKVIKIKGTTLLAGSPGDKSAKEASEWGARGGWFDEGEE